MTDSATLKSLIWSKSKLCKYQLSNVIGEGNLFPLLTIPFARFSELETCNGRRFLRRISAMSVKNGKGDSLITDERFVLLRFEFLNLGSDPLEFDGGSLRNRKGVLLRDSRSSEYPYYRVPRTGRPDQPPPRICPQIPRIAMANGHGGAGGLIFLKPNTPTTCSVIYEVSVDAMEFALIASDLGDGQVSVTETADLNLRPVSRHSVGEYVHVGDVRWQVLSAEELGYVLESNGNQEKTKERFIAVRFQITNKGSA